MERSFKKEVQALKLGDGETFRGVIPFVATDLVRLVILIAFPILALWLPQRMAG